MWTNVKGIIVVMMLLLIKYIFKIFVYNSQEHKVDSGWKLTINDASLKKEQSSNSWVSSHFSVKL